MAKNRCRVFAPGYKAHHRVREACSDPPFSLSRTPPSSTARRPRWPTRKCTSVASRCPRSLKHRIWVLSRWCIGRTRRSGDQASSSSARTTKAYASFFVRVALIVLTALVQCGCWICYKPTAEEQALGDAIPLEKRRNAMNVGRQARHVRTHKHLKNLQRVWLTSDEQMSAFLEVLPRWTCKICWCS